MPVLTRQSFAFALVTGAVLATTNAARSAVDDVGPGGRPNILWITAEDMSPTLGCYGDAYATTPNLDRFAGESVRFTHVFAASPVCSPSRSCLITGMFPATMGTQQMRSAFPLPSGVRGFPAFLRDSGYFCTNNTKTDYNTGDAARLTRESWDESGPEAHWRSGKRTPGQPFFAVFNAMVSHQSRTMTWPYRAFQKHVQSKLEADEIHSTDDAPVPPYYPDTTTVRRTIARYYDCVAVMDKDVGSILDALDRDGLSGDTIVFFFSDHGSGMPRHKRLLHDSGMHVPLMVRVPEKFGHITSAEAGTTSDALVSFVDFPPTVLGLAGVDVPSYMQGVRFLGGGAATREFVFGSRDRVDEVFETARSLRGKRWLYIRNFTPHLSHNQPSVFSDLAEIRKDINRVAAEDPGALTAAQRHYAGPTKPAEEFYDCEADPDNIINLAGQKMDGEQARALAEMRQKLMETRSEIRDCGGLPESEVWRWIRDEGAPMGDIVAGKTDHRPDVRGAWRAADLVGVSEPGQALPLLDDDDPAKRFWAVVALRNSAFDDGEVRGAVSVRMEDVSPAVRIEAASWLAEFDVSREGALEVLVNELKGNADWVTALRACRTIELLGEKAATAKDAMRRVYDRTRSGKGDENLFLAFSSGAFLEKLGEPTLPWDFTPEAGREAADPSREKKIPN